MFPCIDRQSLLAANDQVRLTGHSHDEDLGPPQKEDQFQIYS